MEYSKMDEVIDEVNTSLESASELEKSLIIDKLIKDYKAWLDINLSITEDLIPELYAQSLSREKLYHVGDLSNYDQNNRIEYLDSLFESKYSKSIVNAQDFTYAWNSITGGELRKKWWWNY